jgi:hypothetical protein
MFSRFLVGTDYLAKVNFHFSQIEAPLLLLTKETVNLIKRLFEHEKPVWHQQDPDKQGLHGQIQYILSSDVRHMNCTGLSICQWHPEFLCSTESQHQ